ncbi:inositol monophosphatase family protein [Bryobacter aggregatus]|uniref:inositol monophosphatase family protein n=1 Tax=Bryobacter aggregatus TaxID=360054 RepID=UPI0004E24E78|nr:inositol monophosphatase family protein [Bryobacter aggregatus]
MSSYVETAATIAREASVIIEDLRREGIGYELKGESDLVTRADRASELYITARLRKAFPTHAIIAEEGNNTESKSGYVWYVDPLDGTTNFAHGFPVYNTTLALEKDGKLIAGVIYDGTRDEMFQAEKSSGAYLNGERITASKANRLEDSLWATGFPSKRRHQNINIHFYYQLAMITHGVRRAGAAAIDLAYVACGRLDGFWEFQLNPWDMAAGKLILEEASGTVTDMKGAPHKLTSPHLLATNTHIHQPTLALFSDIFSDRSPYAIPQLSGYEE